MKKLLQLISALLLTLTVNAQDQLYNNSFNMWGTDILGSHPATWVCSYEEGVPPTVTPAVVQKSSDATDLTSSIKLTTADFQGPAFGFVLLGEIGDQGPQGGVPFTISADSLIFDAKFDIQPDDSANVYVILKNSGIPFDMNVFTIGGTSSGWTRMAFKINSLNLTPDSLLLGFTSSDTQNGGAAVGSWIMIDNIRFSDGANYSSPIPNASFEDWNDITAEGTNEWYTLNSAFAGFGGQSAFKSTDAQEGAFALNLVPDSVMIGGQGNEFMPGMAVYGSFDLSTGNAAGKSFAASPTSMTGYYKWTPVNGATGGISVEFKAAGATVGTGAFSFDAAQSTYTQFTIPLTLSSAPDTILVMIDAGQEVGSSLLIDNIQFAGGTVGVKQINLTDATIGVYPNPTTADANLKIALPKTAAVSYVVINALGQQMESDNLGSMKDGVHTIKLNTGDYSTGVYFVKVKIGESTMTQKVIVK